MEKRGVVDASTPEEKGKSSDPKPLPNTKEAADKRADHLTTRMNEAAEQTTKK